MVQLGILGHPVAHSKSPAMHEAAGRALGLPVAYARFDVLPEFVGDAVRGVRALGIVGVNVTVPHKQAVMPFLDAVDDDARLIGAVNTIVRDGALLRGFNTDAPGLVRSLEEAAIPLAGASVTVLGAGGAARAAIVGLARAGAASVTIVARRLAAAQALAAELGSALPCPVVAADEAALETTLRATTLLVQSTSATLDGSADAVAFASNLPLDAMPPGAAVVDLVYKPLETTVLAKARAAGLVCVDGLGMLLHQGAIAFEHFTGQKPPVEVMRAALAAR